MTNTQQDQFKDFDWELLHDKYPLFTLGDSFEYFIKWLFEKVKVKVPCIHESFKLNHGDKIVIYMFKSQNCKKCNGKNYIELETQRIYTFREDFKGEVING